MIEEARIKQKKLMNIVNDYGSIILETKRLKIIGLKIITSKQLFQRLQTDFAHVKADNTSENVLNEILQLIFHCSKQNKFSIYSNIVN